MENKLVIIAPDSFKGTLSASQVCEAIEKGIKSADNNIKTVKIPVADEARELCQLFAVII